MDKSTSDQAVKSPSLRALRGATSVAADEAEAIVGATRELLEELLARNGASGDALVSILFTATPDLTRAFPAAAARDLGLDEVPLLCASEIAVPGAAPRIIRVLVHLYTDRPRAELQHVYLHEATTLRRDLAQP